MPSAGGGCVRRQRLSWDGIAHFGRHRHASKIQHAGFTHDNPGWTDFSGIYSCVQWAKKEVLDECIPVENLSHHWRAIDRDIPSQARVRFSRHKSVYGLLSTDAKKSLDAGVNASKIHHTVQANCESNREFGATKFREEPREPSVPC